MPLIKKLICKLYKRGSTKTQCLQLLRSNRALLDTNYSAQYKILCYTQEIKIKTFTAHHVHIKNVFICCFINIKL